jgi:hypothetical protein
MIWAAEASSERSQSLRLPSEVATKARRRPSGESLALLMLVTPAGGSTTLRQPEVEDLHRAVRADHDVGGLEIAVDDVLLMRRFERIGDLLRDGQCLIDRQGSACDPLRQVLTLDEFHDQRAHPAGFFQTVDVRDVRVVQ